MSSDIEKPLEVESFVAISKAAQALESRELPHGADFHFYMNSTSFKARVDAVAAEALALVRQLPAQADETQMLAASKFTSEDVADELESRLDYLYEALDDTLASAAASVRRQQEEAEVVPGTVGAGDAAQTVAGSRAQNVSPNAFERAQTPRSQLQFDDGVDNSNTPWRPKYDGLPAEAAELRARAAAALESGAGPGHPLADVLGSLTYQPWQLAVEGEPVPPAGFEQTPFTFIDSPAALRQLAGQLEAAREIAVDLEAHSYRSFQGFTCLMQLSTRSADYIVDVIKLRSLIGPVLGPIFADPARVKVLHGADSDIVWLQRDFGIYLANLFDTGQASRVLQYPGHGLAYLLDRFCGFRADKRFQLADWRQRPLSEEMVGYARADTHYLLYIYDALRTELLSMPAIDVPPHLQVGDGNLTALGTVLERSRVLSLSQYTKDVTTETSFLRSAMRTDPPLNDMELAAYRGLFDWRDAAGRREDESTGWVLPKAQLLALARGIPSSVAELVNVLGRKSRYVQQRAKEVVQLIKAATTAERVREAAALRRVFIENAAERDEVHHGSSLENRITSSPPARVASEVLGSQPRNADATSTTLQPTTSPLTSNSASGRPFRPRSLNRPLATGVSTEQSMSVTEQREDQGTVSRMDATSVAVAGAPATASTDTSQLTIQQTTTNILQGRRRITRPVQLAASSRAFGVSGSSTASKGNSGRLSQERTAIVASIQASLALPFVAAAETLRGPEATTEDGAALYQEDNMEEETLVAPTTATDVRAAMDEMHAATSDQPLLPELDQGDYVPVPEENHKPQQQRKRSKPASGLATQRKTKDQTSRRQKDFKPFDYGAAKQQFPGALPPAGGGTLGSDRNKREASGGRGGKSGGRRGGKRGTQGGVFNPFQIKDPNIKKGKRSSTVKTKSGNRSAHF